MLSEQYSPLKGGHITLMHEVARRIGGVTVLTALASGCARKEIIDGVTIKRVNLDRRWYLRPESMAMYANLLLQGLVTAGRIRPAALLAARALPEGFVAIHLCRLLGVPSIIFAHGEEITPWTRQAPEAERRKFTAGLKGRCLWAVYLGATRIIANSRFTQRLLTGGGIAEEKVAVVHPGTDPDRYKPTAKDEILAAQLGVQGRRVILTVGRLMWRKGQDMVLRALPGIIAAVPDVVYLICGTGPYEADLRDLANALGLNSHVRFLGEVDTDLLPALYNLSDVFVMPNRVSPRTQDVEGFGIVFLEANACGIPVVGGRSGGVPDAVEDGKTGLLVDGTSVQEIAQATIRILQDPSLARRLGENGRVRVCQRLTWDYAAGHVKSLLSALGPS